MLTLELKSQIPGRMKTVVYGIRNSWNMNFFRVIQFYHFAQAGFICIYSLILYILNKWWWVNLPWWIYWISTRLTLIINNSNSVLILKVRFIWLHMFMLRFSSWRKIQTYLVSCNYKEQTVAVLALVDLFCHKET